MAMLLSNAGGRRAHVILNLPSFFFIHPLGETITQGLVFAVSAPSTGSSETRNTAKRSITISTPPHRTCFAPDGLPRVRPYGTSDVETPLPSPRAFAAWLQQQALTGHL